MSNACARFRAAFVGCVALAAPAAADLTPHSLTDISQKLLAIYNAADAPALHELLAPSLKAKYSVDAVRRMLERCRGMTGEVARFSLPSYGGRHYGFFGVYAQTAIFEMILEIDRDEKLFHFVITDDVTAKEQACTLNNFR